MKKSKPGPGLSTLKKEQSDIYVEEGFIEAIKPFLIKMQQQPGWTAKDCLCSICYDEIKLRYWALFDSKTQRLVGPHAFGLLVTVRGLTSNWSYPIFTKFDHAPTKEDVIEIIKWLYEIGLICILTVSDMGINFVHCFLFCDYCCDFCCDYCCIYCCVCCWDCFDYTCAVTGFGTANVTAVLTVVSAVVTPNVTAFVTVVVTTVVTAFVTAVVTTGVAAVVMPDGTTDVTAFMTVFVTVFL